MRLSILVVTWQSAGDLTGLVESMNRLLDGSEELIVVDNGSSDEPERVIRSWKGSGWFLQMGRNLGYGAAANAGVVKAGGDAVVILNADTELIDDGLPELAAVAMGRSAIVGPRILGREGEVQASASGPPVGVWPWVRALLPPMLAPAAVLAKTAPWRLDRLTRVTWLTGCCIAGPRELLQRLGPFDPDIHLYGEDLDLGLRASRAGVPSFIAPETCRIVHKGKGSSGQRFDDLGRAQAGANGRAVLRRRYGTSVERRAWWAERTNLRLRVTAKRVLRRDHGWDALVLEGLRDSGDVPELPSPEGRQFTPRRPEQVRAI